MFKSRSTGYLRLEQKVHWRHSVVHSPVKKERGRIGQLPNFKLKLKTSHANPEDFKCLLVFELQLTDSKFCSTRQTSNATKTADHLSSPPSRRSEWYCLKR